MCWDTMLSDKNGGKPMTDVEKKLLQAKHCMEKTQARNRVMERNARTRRLIQEGTILKKSDARGTGDGVIRPQNLSLVEAITIQSVMLEGLGKTGVFLFSPVRAHLLATC